MWRKLPVRHERSSVIKDLEFCGKVTKTGDFSTSRHGGSGRFSAAAHPQLILNVHSLHFRRSERGGTPRLCPIRRGLPGFQHNEAGLAVGEQIAGFLVLVDDGATDPPWANGARGRERNQQDDYNHLVHFHSTLLFSSGIW